jgi:RNA polymerase sigma-70 factor (ECF subfamily)
MADQKFLAEQFESNRNHLRRVAYRMLGSLTEADDAVQEAWLRLARSDVGEIGNLGGWLTTVVARVCLDMLRGRKSRREDPMGPDVPEPIVGREGGTDPEQELQMADSVGLALLVVLEALAPAERIAFVLHDMFDLPFDEIAPILGRSPTAARQLASRARRRVQGADKDLDADVSGQRKVVDAFLAASRDGDFESLLAVLDPDVVVTADDAAARLGGSHEMRGAQAVARAFMGRAQTARSALVDGAVGAVVAPRGQLLMVVSFTIANGKIARIDAVANPERLGEFDLAVLDEG